MNIFYSILAKLIEKEEYFKFQYDDLENKKNVDQIDQELNTDPNFQQYVFSSEEYFQNFTNLTENIKKPVLVIAGDNDNAIGPKQYLNFKFSKSKIQVLHSSHHPYIENRFEFKDAILNFINGR